MTLPGQGPLSRDEGQALHERLLAGDPTAPADLALTYLDRVADWLIRRNPRVAAEDCVTATIDALLALIKDPATYHPGRQTLEVYLRLSASGDLKNLLRRERRHSSRRADWEAVELSPVVGKYLWDEGGDPARIVERHEEAPPPTPQRSPVALSPAEERALTLLDAGERKTEVYAAALGVADLPPAQQRREVKRGKDRLKKRRERAGDADE